MSAPEMAARNEGKLEGKASDFVNDIVEFIAESCSPEEIFDEEVLTAWATENGYIHKDAEEGKSSDS